MRIAIDRAACAGLGVCESMAADYFEVDDGGELQLRRPSVAPCDRAVVRDAVASCPTGALSLEE